MHREGWPKPYIYTVCIRYFWQGFHQIYSIYGVYVRFWPTLHVHNTQRMYTYGIIDDIYIRAIMYGGHAQTVLARTWNKLKPCIGGTLHDLAICSVLFFWHLHVLDYPEVERNDCGAHTHTHTLPHPAHTLEYTHLGIIKKCALW